MMGINGRKAVKEISILFYGSELVSGGGTGDGGSELESNVIIANFKRAQIGLLFRGATSIMAKLTILYFTFCVRSDTPVTGVITY